MCWSCEGGASKLRGLLPVAGEESSMNGYICRSALNPGESQYITCVKRNNDGRILPRAKRPNAKLTVYWRETSRAAIAATASATRMLLDNLRMESNSRLIDSCCKAHRQISRRANKRKKHSHINRRSRIQMRSNTYFIAVIWMLRVRAYNRDRYMLPRSEALQYLNKIRV
jgi:hypothetical protein